MSSSTLWTVAQLNRYVAQLFQQQLSPCWVKGEVSNAVRAASGHWYFTLKDAQASVRCVMFAQVASGLGFVLRNGQALAVYARVSLYEPRGDYQLQVLYAQAAGLGNLHEAFDALKRKLQAQGLFDSARKKPLPLFVSQVAVVTSLGAAALKDVLTTLERRTPHIKVQIYPSLVQGVQAPASLMAALQQADSDPQTQLVLLVRGGGSIEDLWTFNDEALAHTIANMRLPVVSGVGHESDVTIADFVADCRAPTPTAAAEMISPTTASWQQQVQQWRKGLLRQWERQWQLCSLRVDIARQGLRTPEKALTLAQQRLRLARHRLQSAWRLRCDRAQVRLRMAQAALQAYGPQRTLARGYAIAYADSQVLVTSATQVQPGQGLTIVLSQGQLRVTVDSID